MRGLVWTLILALFVPIESSSQLISVRNDGEGGVTLANERTRTVIFTNEKTGILTSDQSKTKDDPVPGVWVGPTRRQQKMIFGMAVGMYDFYSSLGEFWNKYGNKSKSLNWIEMYSTYRSDSAFEQMIKKKERASKFLFPQDSIPTKTQVKEMIKYLNSHPNERRKIAALKEVLQEFTS